VAESSIGSIFLRTLAPRYYRSMYISMGLTAVGILAAGVLVRRGFGPCGQLLIYRLYTGAVRIVSTNSW